MSRKEDSDKVFHSLPPLPDFDDDVVAKPVAKEQPEVKSMQKSLDALSLELETELHQSDLYRKEELASSETSSKSKKPVKRVKKKKSVKTSVSPPLISPSKPPVVESVSDDELAHIVDEEVIHHTTQFDAVDSGIDFDTVPAIESAESVDEVVSESIKEADLMHRRQQDYFDTLRAKLDHEMRERQEHVKQKEVIQHVRSDELAKWESALLHKEKRVATHKLEYNKIKSLQEKLENNTLSLKYEKARVRELESRLKLKEKTLTSFEKKLRLKEEQLHELAKELVTRGAVIEKHTQEQIAHFQEQEAKIETKYGESLVSTHVREPAVPKAESKPAMSVARHFSKPLSLRRSNALEKLRIMVLNCYDYLGKGNIQKASAEYAIGATAYKDFAAEFGNDSAIHAEFTQLHRDIAIQMRN